jgi:hypothetical protein
MQFMLLIYGDEGQWVAMTPEEQAAAMPEWMEYTAWLKDKGWYAAGDALRETAQATSVAIKDGERVVTDGPFAETKEQLGGYYAIDVSNLDDAIEAAARCPGAKHGTIEIRPIEVFEGAG